MLRGEGFRHPFRQSLPLTIVQIARDERDSETTAVAETSGLGDDINLFILSFLAFFTAFYTFIF